MRAITSARGLPSEASSRSLSSERERENVSGRARQGCSHSFSPRSGVDFEKKCVILRPERRKSSRGPCGCALRQQQQCEQRVRERQREQRLVECEQQHRLADYNQGTPPIVFGTVDYGYNRPPCMADVLGHSIGRGDGASVNLAFELDRNKRKWSSVAGSFVERHMTTVS